jgi:hypothetical protein
MGAGAVALALSGSALAVPQHVVDGLFGPSEWTVSASDATPVRPTVTVSTFTVGGVANGAELFAEQSNNGFPTGGSLGNKLELLYDCLICGAPLPANAALDIFFQSGGNDYVVHVFSSQGAPAFTAFEKPTGSFSPLNPDGSLDLSAPVWTALDAGDLLLAQFVVGVGFGPTPNSAADHYFGEFELSVNTAPVGVPPNGLYSPDPAFWSASTSGDGFPTGPISSGIFTLNSDGSTTVAPVVGPDGDPVLQVPEPVSPALLLAALGAWHFTRRHRKG